MSEANARVAYFSMEIGLVSELPTYSGGLGVLAGDTIRAASDLKVPMVAVTLLHRQGYCRQLLDAQGHQTEEPVTWRIEDHLRLLEGSCSVEIEGRTVQVRAWTRDVAGRLGHRVPVLFLDCDVAENSAEDRRLTDHLYGGDDRYRLCQEVVLGIGGVRMLRCLGYSGIARFHMNEGHASLLACELLRERLTGQSTGASAGRVGDESDLEAIRQQCVFTTHTPVPAGHDQFPIDIVKRVLGSDFVEMLHRLECIDGRLNTTELALHLSRYVNGVARRHGEISRKMFHDEAIDSITNGVHIRTWASAPFQELFDRHIPTWREDSFSLRNALSIPNHEVWDAHARAKRALIEYVNELTGVAFEQDVFTIGFARRAAAYKRADLFFDDVDRLRRMHAQVSPFQVVFAGKAHPRDQAGKEVIRRIHAAMATLKGEIRIAYLPNYDMELCKTLTSGVDLWMNTPEPPMEASGTSGMKAAINGIPSLSVIDGWWVEGWIEGTTGWAIGQCRGGRQGWPPEGEQPDRKEDAASLYDKLEHVILPLYYRQREQYVSIQRACIALNGSFFNTHRMMHQYVVKAYFV